MNSPCGQTWPCGWTSFCEGAMWMNSPWGQTWPCGWKEGANINHIKCTCLGPNCGQVTTQCYPIQCLYHTVFLSWLWPNVFPSWLGHNPILVVTQCLVNLVVTYSIFPSTKQAVNKVSFHSGLWHRVFPSCLWHSVFPSWFVTQCLPILFVTECLTILVVTQCLPILVCDIVS